MTTSLAKQLLKLKLPESQLDAAKDRPSLLFEPKVAATYDKDTFYALGTNGFQELCGLNSSFHELYYDKLFSEVAADVERSVKTKEFNNQLNAAIDSFLLQLSPYFLLRPAQKCIEWLLYRFRIHMFNTESILKCAFPYYGTNLFVRVVQLLDTKRTSSKWKDLAEAQVAGTPMTRNDMISYCSRNLWFLEFLCNAVLQSVKVHSKGQGQWQIRGWINLFTSTILGVIHLSSQIKETQLHQIMAVISKGISSKLVDFQAACYMIVSQLFVKTNLNAKALDTIVRLTTKHCLPQLHKEAVCMIALLFKMQKHNGKLQKRVFRRLSSWESLMDCIIVLTSNTNGNGFMEAFLDRLIPQAFVVAGSEACSAGDTDDGFRPTDENYQYLLKSIVDETTLSRPLQDHLFKLLLSNYGKHAGDTSGVVNEVLYRVQKKYPDAFDQAVSQCSQSSKLSDEVLQKFLADSLASLKHQLLQGSRFTLTFAISHPERSIRLQAIKKLDTIFSNEKLNEDSKVFVINSISSLLVMDNQPEVVKEVLKLLTSHLSIFLEPSGKIFEETLNMIENKWYNLKFAKVVQMGINFLINSTMTDVVEQEKQSFLKNKIRLIVLYQLVKSVASNGEGFKKSQLVKSSFIKENVVLQKLCQSPGRNLEKFCEKFCRILSEEDNHEFLTIVFDSAPHCSNGEFYIPVLFLLLHVGIQSNCKETCMKSVTFLINFSKPSNILKFVDQLESMQDSTVNGITELMLEEDFDRKMQLTCQSLLLLWKDVAAKLPQIACVSIDCNELLLQDPSDLTSSTLLIKEIFLMLLHLKTYQSLTPAGSFIKEVFNTFMNWLLLSGNDVMSFLSTYWLQFLTCEWNGTHVATKRFVLSFNVLLDLIHSGRIEDLQEDQSSLFDSSFVIPSLLLSCTSHYEMVRSAALQVLQILTTFSSFPFKSLFDHLLSYSEEIQMDPSHLAQVLAQYFQVRTKKGCKQKKELAKMLTDHVVKPLHGKLAFYAAKFYETCFLKIENPAEFEVFLPCLDKLLDNCVDSSHVALVDECSMIALMLRKITNCTDKRKGSLYVKALKVDPSFLKNIEDEKLITQLVALELLNGKFFVSLDYETMKEIIDILVTIKSTASDEKILNAASKAFKSITIPFRLVLDQLDNLGLLPQSSPQQNIIEAKRAKIQKSASGDQGVKPEIWKKFLVLLELLHHKKRIQHPENLIGPFFDLLTDVIEKKYVADNLDYVTLLLLGCLLNLFERAKSLDATTVSQMKINIKVELLVQCIHSTKNTQTHQHALMLLAKTAQFCPLCFHIVATWFNVKTHNAELFMATSLVQEKVLHSVMSVFTFMGSTILRRDDSYSFQIISQTIKTIIPSLMHIENKRKKAVDAKSDAVLGILRVFVDSLPHIPSHRRLIVFEELLSELDPDVYLWQFMALAVDQRVSKLTMASTDGDTEQVRSAEDAASKMEESLLLWTSICELFSVPLRIRSVVSILTFLQTYIKQLGAGKKHAGQKSSIIDMSKRSTNQMRRFHVVMLTLASYVIRSIKASAVNDLSEDVAAVESLLESALVYFDHVSHVTEKEGSKDEVSERYQKNIIRRVNDVLEKINALLSMEKFLDRLYQLLDVRSISERGLILQKLIQLFHRRVAHSGNKFTPEEERGLLKLSKRFLKMLTESCESSNQNETSLHTAALGLTQIIRITCQNNPKSFVATQPIICDVISSRTLSNNVLSSLLICLGELVLHLKAHSIGNLNKISSCFIQLLGDEQVKQSSSVYLSLLTTINKLFTCLGHFLSPHVQEFLTKLSLLHCYKKQAAPKSVTSAHESHSKSSHKRQKVASISDAPAHQLAANVLDLVADKVAPRVWIPVLLPAYDAIQQQHPQAVLSLLSMVGHRIRKLNKDELTLHSNNLIEFYLHAMTFRNQYSKKKFKEMDGIESEALDGAIAFLIKLPETNFRPLYMKLYEWGCSCGVSLAQSITFYRCTSVMAARLKGLFEIFAADLLEDISDELKDSMSQLNEEGVEENDLVKKQSYVLDTLSSMLNFSSNNLLTQETFEKLLHPLLKQLEVELPNRSKVDAYVNKHVIKCVGRLAAAARDDVSWRPLNYEVLMKTRHVSPEVRCYALECLKVCVENLSENYLSQLPETIPFLAELLEDESSVVEDCCQRVIKRIEEVLGEPLQKYF